MKIETIIQELVTYAKEKLGLKKYDAIYVQNELLNLFHLDSIENEEIDVNQIRSLEVPDLLINKLRDYLKDNTSMSSNEVEREIVQVMGIITPTPEMVISTFQEIEKTNSKEALDYLYKLQIHNNYIQKTAVDKNLYWKAPFDKNYLEITVNLSKPEKKNSDIAKLIAKKDISYPKCVICLENLGYAGRDNHPARENIRIIPLNLNGEDWFMQYSPYVYYYEHCIVICENHEPMQMGKRIFSNLLSFVDRFPCFFIGSNANLPIVGGSILNHEHFQGGAHLMPLMYSNPVFNIKAKDYPNCQIDYLDWYVTTIRLASKNKEELIACASKIYSFWCNYEDKEIDIIPHHNETQHSTITPIARKIDDTYYLFLLLRNNRTSKEHPDGIFHAHKEYHNIKSEGIGLIEAMGMFILPARLERQPKELAQLFVNRNVSFDDYVKEHEDLEIHREFITRLLTKHQDVTNEETAIEIIRNEISLVCKHILENVAVFKKDEKGQEHFAKFIKELDL